VHAQRASTPKSELTKKERVAMATFLTQEEKIKRGAEDAGQYFRSMMEFVGFSKSDGEAIRESAIVIEKYIPSIVADFYDHLLRYPTTRVYFLKPDGSLDEEYIHKRMSHLGNFWRRSASGEYDDDYARYVDYVGRAHTRHGADPNIYIAERYVIGQVGFMQRSITSAIHKELHEYDPDLENRSVNAWNMLMMVILEMLARAYEEEHEVEPGGYKIIVDREAVQQMAIDAYEKGLGLGRIPLRVEIHVGREDEIPEGQRKLIQLGKVSIGVFHHKSGWYALRNQCLHAGGPVATGVLTGDTLTCPWHGYQYNVTSGRLLVDPSAKLETYPVILKAGEVFIDVPETLVNPEEQPPAQPVPEQAAKKQVELQKNEFLVGDVPPGKTALVIVADEPVAIYNVDGKFYATSNTCTHAGGPLSKGKLTGDTIVCPWHGSCFDVTSGAVRCGPAQEPVASYRVNVDGQVGRVLPR